LEELPATPIHTCMEIPSFHEWREHRRDEIPDATTLALLITRAGAAGVSGTDLRRLARIPPETLDALLAGLRAAGQVMVVSVGGELRYRAVG